MFGSWMIVISLTAILQLVCGGLVQDDRARPDIKENRIRHEIHEIIHNHGNDDDDDYRRHGQDHYRQRHFDNEYDHKYRHGHDQRHGHDDLKYLDNKYEKNHHKHGLVYDDHRIGHDAHRIGHNDHRLGRDDHKYGHNGQSHSQVTHDSIDREHKYEHDTLKHDKKDVLTANKHGHNGQSHVIHEKIDRDHKYEHERDTQTHDKKDVSSVNKHGQGHSHVIEESIDRDHKYVAGREQIHHEEINGKSKGHDIDNRHGHNDGNIFSAKKHH